MTTELLLNGSYRSDAYGKRFVLRRRGALLVLPVARAPTATAVLAVVLAEATVSAVSSLASCLVAAGLVTTQTTESTAVLAALVEARVAAEALLVGLWGRESGLVLALSGCAVSG